MAYSRFGIDVSECNGVIDWKKVKDEGRVRFAIIRCGYGSDYTNQDDTQFENNIRGCQENHIPYGVYLYSYATNADMAKSEAEHCKRLLKKCGSWWRLGVWYDIEESKQLALGGQMNNILNAWRTAMGKPCRRVGLYVNPNFLRNCFTNISSDVPLWVACWGSDKPSGASYDKMMMWQYGTAKGISGINGDVDGNYCYKSIFHDYNGKYPKSTTKKTSSTSYIVKVTATSGLNCRSGAGTSYSVVKAYPYATKLTITKESNGWGKTSDGWVSLAYTKKV